MPTRQDQLHSHQFAVQRVVAALVMRETDPAQSPFRRAAGAALASVLIAAVSLGAVAAYGVFKRGGSDKWRTAGAVIVEQESGARYVHLEGRLHPVVNQASAVLITGSAAEAVRVSRKSIAGVPRGVPLGIPDAPDPLPAPSGLTGRPWTVCSDDPPGEEAVLRSTLLVGAAPGGGEPLADRGALVRPPDGELYLIWQGRRHLVRDEKEVRTALLWDSRSAQPVAPALVNALPAGADLKLIDIPGRGERSVAVPGARIGEVFVVEGQGDEQYAVAMRDGLAGITYVQRSLLLVDPRTKKKIGQEEEKRLSLSEFAAIPKLDPLPAGGAAPPPAAPELAAADTGALCVSVGNDVDPAVVRVGAQPPDADAAVPTAKRSPDGAVLADFVLVPAGSGALVEAVATPAADGGALSIVTDLGRRYAVADDEALQAIGFAKVEPLRLPAGVVALLPAGPALDRDAADEPAGEQ